MNRLVAIPVIRRRQKLTRKEKNGEKTENNRSFFLIGNPASHFAQLNRGVKSCLWIKKN